MAAEPARKKGVWGKRARRAGILGGLVYGGHKARPWLKQGMKAGRTIAKEGGTFMSLFPRVPSGSAGGVLARATRYAMRAGKAVGYGLAKLGV